jgi:hypothetical protein
VTNTDRDFCPWGWGDVRGFLLNRGEMIAKKPKLAPQKPTTPEIIAGTEPHFQAMFGSSSRAFIYLQVTLKVSGLFLAQVHNEE